MNREQWKQAKKEILKELDRVESQLSKVKKEKAEWDMAFYAGMLKGEQYIVEILNKGFRNENIIRDR